MTVSKRLKFCLSGLFNGTDCICFDVVPLNGLLEVKEENFCNQTCSGDNHYMCGGLNSVSMFVASKLIYSNKKSIC